MFVCHRNSIDSSSSSEDEDFSVSLEPCRFPELCLQCEQTISPGDIQVIEAIDETLGQYHLNCYVPISCIQYTLPTVTVSISPSLNMSQWPAIEAHNAHLTARFIVTPMKRLQFPRTKPVRVLLEAFKYLDPIQDVGKVTGVNSTWYEVSWMDELWLCYSNEKFQNKWKFIENWIGYCGECGKQLIRNSAQVVCPVTKRPICRYCASAKDYTVYCVYGNWSKVLCIKKTRGFALTFKKFIN